MFQKSGYDRRRFIIAAAMTTASLSLGLPFLYHVNTGAKHPLNGVVLPEPLSSFAASRLFEVEFLDPLADLYSFTFG